MVFLIILELLHLHLFCCYFIVKFLGGYTPLHHLVKTPTSDLKIDMIEMILKHGANPNIKSKDDFKPLDIFPELGSTQES